MVANAKEIMSPIIMLYYIVFRYQIIAMVFLFINNRATSHVRVKLKNDALLFFLTSKTNNRIKIHFFV